ncbi:STAS domain-containing protein [Actinomadura sp. 6N118]|uniref:STAS domain-containing protein n=1 Tax=Actinomadura sp. 6N118 TaxID=3375151 RepID=UPI0037A3619A
MLHTVQRPAPERADKALSVLRRPAYTVARLRGEIDIATAPPLRERLLAAVRPDTRLLVLDVAGVPFCDAAGLGVLLGTWRRANALGVAFVLAGPCPQVVKLLEATGLDSELTVRATVADAIAWPLTRHGAVRPSRAKVSVLR